MGQQYFIKRGERVRGPFTSQQIKSGIRSEKIKPVDLLGRSDAGPWKEVRSIIEKDIGEKDNSLSHQVDVSDANVSELAPGASDTPSSDTVANIVKPASLPSRDGPAEGNVTVRKAPPPASVTTRASFGRKYVFSK